MGRLPLLVVRRASPEDFEAVRGLLTEASRWLATKDTDQWATPWPDEDGRNERIRKAVEAGRTWIVLDNESRAAATLTASPNHHGIWPDDAGRDPAVYVRRLTVSRRYAGRGLGGQLHDWAGLRASREYGARWVRVNVWTTNARLRDYYHAQGFDQYGRSPIPGYPSAALFQKPVDQIRAMGSPLFREDPGTAKAPG